ncbi:hypothetical protein HZ326_12885 [Fusarium oxysporum f. sp. albedinis]|nr:hypothetical protein HZ326_12885 [Fusarium oxysporum f. sp. albedinis]
MLVTLATSHANATSQPPKSTRKPSNHQDKPFPISIGHYQTSIPLSSDPRVRKSAPIRVFAGVILTYPSLSKVPGGILSETSIEYGLHDIWRNFTSTFVYGPDKLPDNVNK